VKRVVEDWEAQLVSRGDAWPIREGFRFSKLLNQEIWDPYLFCGNCTCGCHYVAEHVYLSTGWGRDWLEEQRGVLASMSVTRDVFVACDLDGLPTVDTTLIAAQAKPGGLPPCVDLGTESGASGTVTFFRRGSPYVGFDISTKKSRTDLAGGSVHEALKNCLSGYECRTRSEGLCRHGSRLSEVVVPRSALSATLEKNRLNRVATVSAADLPLWVRWAVGVHRGYGGACSPCRREAASVLWGWVLAE